MPIKTFDSTAIRAVIRRFQALIGESETYLTELDSALGDGDLGFVMVRGAAAAAAATGSADVSPGRLLMQAGMAIAKEAPSTMGTLIATGFMRGGKAVADCEELGSDGMVSFFDAFITGISERGKAAPGDKTVIDALLPAFDALQQALGDGASLADSLSKAHHACIDGAESTREMLAKHGRPAYYGVKSVGMMDPGAQVGVIIMRAFAETAAG